jgi:glycine betaine/proline transport system substrate-binding protein
MKVKAFAVSSILALVMTAFLVAPGKAESACQVHLGDLNWNSANFHTQVAAFILRHGYGCEVERTYGGTLPIMAAHYEGKVDLVMELWYDNVKDQYDPFLKAGKVEMLGVNTPDVVEAWYIPRFVREANPGLKSVYDLPKYKHLFKDPEEPSKGRFVNCPPGWGCEVINTVKLRAYGLEEHFTNFRPGSGGALKAAIKGAYLKKKAVLGYYWSPTTLFAQIDLVALEEPVWNVKDWDEMMKHVGMVKKEGVQAMGSPKKATAYRTTILPKTVTTKFAAENPNIVEFIKQYTMPSKVVLKSLLYMEEKAGGEAKAAAIDFLKTNDVWKSWVPADVVKKVTAALADA